MLDFALVVVTKNGMISNEIESLIIKFEFSALICFRLWYSNLHLLFYTFSIAAGASTHMNVC